MDLLFKRYASPYLLVDEMISAGQFSDFVTQLVGYDADQSLWDFYLHKVDGQSYNNWKASLSGAERSNGMSDGQIETTINESYLIINNFEPDRKEVERIGTV